MNELDKIAAAISSLCDEHGAPNNFTATEIADFARVPRMLVGRSLKDEIKFGIIAEHVRSPYRLSSYQKHGDGYSYANVR